MISELTLIRGHNIRKLVEDMGPELTGKMKAQKLGLKYGTYAIVIRDPVKANIGHKTCKSIENKLRLPPGWLDKDRREGMGNSDSAAVEQSAQTLSMNANGFVVSNKAVTNHQANEIMRILLDE